MTTAAWYIDGFNLYHSLRERPETSEYRWLDLRLFAQKFSKPDETVGPVVFFSARADWNSGKGQRHDTYCAALRHVGVEVVLGHFQLIDEQCRATCLLPYKKHGEKRTDVSLALRAYMDAASQKCDSVYIVSADSDQVPTVEAIRALPKPPRINFVFPPVRSSSELRQLAPVQELGKKSFKGCRLPAKIRTESGRVVRCPATWHWDGIDTESEAGGL